LWKNVDQRQDVALFLRACQLVQHRDLLENVDQNLLRLMSCFGLLWVTFDVVAKKFARGFFIVLGDVAQGCIELGEFLGQ
jgi:hypothetical protein